MQILYNILSNNTSRNIRNFLNIKPTLYLKPQDLNTTLSDFFYWKQNESFSTKFMLTNLSSQFFPENNEIDYVNIYVFNNEGLLLNIYNIELQPFETKECFFSEMNLSGFGSFLVFHKFESTKSFIDSGTFLTERGYVGYKYFEGVWNFMHGNNYTCYLNKQNNITSIMAKSFFKTSYIPQVSFDDCISSKIIVNNPFNKVLKYKLNLLDKNKKIIKSIKYELKKFSTYELSIISECSLIEIISNLMLSRPIIKKKYKSYFDIFHG